MKENNEIDELFKAGIQQEFPVDPALWAAVEGQLNQAAPMQRGRWFFSLNTIALLVVLFACATIPTDNVRTNTLHRGTSSLLLPKQITTETTSSNETEPNTFNTNTSSINTLNNKQTATTLNPSNKTTKTSTENSSTSVPSSYKKEERKKNVAVVQSLSIASTSINEKSENNNIAQTKVQAIDKVILTETENQQNKTLKREPSALSKSVVEKPALLAKKEQILPSLSLKEYPMVYIPSLKLKDEYVPSNAVPLAPTIEYRLKQFQNTRKAPSYFIELESSFSITSSKKLKGDNDAFIQYKEANETSRRNNSYGLNVIRQHKYLTYGLGLQFSKYTEQVNYTVDKEALGYLISYDTTYRVVNDNFNSGGTPVLLIEEQINERKSPITLIVDDQIVATNTFKRLQIPLFVGIQKSYNNWSAELRTALTVNYLFEQNGFYISEDLKRVESFENQERFNKFNFGSRSNFSIGYALNEFVVIGSRFSYAFDINSFTKNYDSRLSSQSLGLWMMWRPF